MLKRLTALILVLLFVAGCSSGSGSKPAPAGTAEGTKTTQQYTLDFPSWQAEEPGFAEFWKELIAVYKQDHPNVEIKLTQIPFKSYVETMTTRFAGNNPPDIVHLPTRNFAQFADQGWLMPLDEQLKGTDIPATWTKLQEEMVWNKQTQGVLLMGYGFMLFYNEKMLQDAGLSVPKSPEELIAAAKALTKDGVFGFGMTTTEHPNIFSDVSHFVAGEGSAWVKDGKYNLADPKLIQAIDHWRELSKYAPKGTTSEQKRQLFFDGKIAMIMDGPFVLASAKTAAETVKPHVRIVPAPFAQIPGSVSNGLHIAAATPKEKQQLVWDFIKLAASPKFQDRYAALTKSPAPRKNAATPETVKADPELGVIGDAAARAVSFTPESNNIKANYNEFSKMVSAAMMKLLTTDAPTAKVMTDLDKELNAKIKP